MVQTLPPLTNGENNLGDDVLEELNIENNLELLNIKVNRINRDTAPLKHSGKDLIKGAPNDRFFKHGLKMLLRA